MNVLVTGANGRVGTAITDHLFEEERYEFTLLDREEHPDYPEASAVADVTEYEALRPHFDGQDAVVHLALVPGHGGASDPAVGWSDSLSKNLEGINNVYEAAVDAGLERIVFASSNHAVGMVEVRNRPDCYEAFEPLADETEPHRPDSRYGLTKSYGEDLGRLAAERNGVRFYALRIGALREPEYDHPYGDAERGVDQGKWERGSDAYEEQVARMKGFWQSRRDFAHMVECCLRDDTVEWDHFYGLSDNDRGWLKDLAHAREAIGYDPKDNGEEWAAPPEGRGRRTDER